ncbi:MAG: hypothetical protein ABJI22_13690 [Maribacter sp.]
MQILQFNPGKMVLIPLLIIVGVPLVLIILAIRAFINKRKKRALWFISFTIMYVVLLYIIMWIADGSSIARF